MKLVSALNITPQKLFVDLRPKLRLQPHLGLQTSPLLQELMPLEILSPPYYVFPGKCWSSSLLDGAAAWACGTTSDKGWSNSAVFEEYLKNHFAI